MPWILRGTGLAMIGLGLALAVACAVTVSQTIRVEVGRRAARDEVARLLAEACRTGALSAEACAVLVVR